METLRYVVLVNGLLAVVSVAYYLLLRRETFFRANRLVLWLGTLGSLLLPLLELPDWRPQPVRTVMQRTAQVLVPSILPQQAYDQPDITITFPNKRTYKAFQTRPRQFVWTWQLGLLLLYIGVVILLLARFGIQLLSLRKLIRQSEQEPYDDFVLVGNKTVTSPFSFFKWVVLNPAQHTSDELDQILRHERVHVRERHSVDMLTVELVCIVFWFNPAAYLFRHLIHQILEFSADRAVLAEGIDAKSYQYNLLKVSLLTGQSALTNHFSKSQLKSRIEMLNQPNSPAITWLKYPVFLLVTLAVVSAFARPKAIIAFSRPAENLMIDRTGSFKKPASENKRSSNYTSIDPKVDPSTTSKASTKSVELSVNSVAIDDSKLVNEQTEANQLRNEHHTKSSQLGQNIAPEEFSRQLPDVTANDLPATADSIDDKEMEAMVLEGQRKYGHLGVGPRRFYKEEIKKLSSPGSYLQVNVDGFLSVDEKVSYAKVFINNEPVFPKAVSSFTINQLYALAVVYGYKPEGQNQVGTRYILFYIDKYK